MNSNDSINKKEKSGKSRILQIFILVVVFLALGIFIGIYGTSKFMKNKENNEPSEPIIVEDLPVDIMEDEEYKTLIEDLYKTINGQIMFYSTNGVNISTMDNNTKLMLVYNYLNSTQQGTTETLQQTYWGSNVCQNNFIVDPSTDTSTSSSCTVTKFSRDLFVETNKKLFNDEVLDTSVNFNPSSFKSCVVDIANNVYICGNISNTSGITGDLESRFTIIKVTKDKDNTIKIYEKGYLLDNRSNIKAQYPTYDNVYLHSTDSTDYYFELKNADNLTFVHTFKINESNEYYYISTELEE